MQITYKFRLYPNAEQEQKLLWTLEECRFVYNAMLEGLRKQEKPDRYELQSRLPELKERYPELKGVHSKVLQYEVYRLFSNLRALSELKKKGRKVGKLRFKGRGWFKTFTYNQSGFSIIKTGNRLDTLRLSKIGDIPIRMHREIEGKIKQITIKHKQTGEWFACIISEIEAETKREKENKQILNPIGIDVGIRSFSTDSDGIRTENPRYYKKGLKRLERAQRKLSRKKPKSKNRDKQRAKVAKIHERIANQRDDFLHKLSRSYIENYDFIVVEDLNIRGMVRNHHLSQSVLDCSWARFIQYLEYKAERANIPVVKVKPNNTSQTCSGCGRELKEHIPLSERMFRCPVCGMEIDRDTNASRNILKRGLEKLPQELREVTPVEIEPLRKLGTVSASAVVEAGSLLQNQ